MNQLEQEQLILNKVSYSIRENFVLSKISENHSFKKYGRDAIEVTHLDGIIENFRSRNFFSNFLKIFFRTGFLLKQSG